MIRAVISDFGGVLTSPLRGSFAAYAQRAGVSLEALGAAFGVLRVNSGADPLHELERGHLSEAAFVADLRGALCAVTGRDVALAGFADLLAELAPNAPMIELMAQLRDEGYRMALLTNNVREWERQWRALAPVDELFEVVVDSSAVGMRKPDAEIYELTMERLGIPAAHECLFVDDREDNCAGAAAVGMRAVRYVDAAQAIDEIRAALADGR